jgi:O-antigen ligase
MLFLKSSTAEILIGPDALRGLLEADPNNVLDPLKAGGIFINANVASLFLGVASLAATLVALQSPKVQARWWACSLVCLTAVFFTGSKAGAALAIAVPIGLVLAVRLRRLPGPVVLPSALVLVGTMGWLLPTLLSKVAPTYLEKSSGSYSDRSMLWHAAIRIIGESPLIGNGFGGWALAIPTVSPGFELPPHNLLIAAWSNLGIWGPLLLIMFFVATFRAGLRKLARSSSAAEALSVALALGVWMWILVHGMGDNTTVYGESHTLVVAAMLLAFITNPETTIFGRRSQGEVQAPLKSHGAGRELGSSVVI